MYWRLLNLKKNPLRVNFLSVYCSREACHCQALHKQRINLIRPSGQKLSAGARGGGVKVRGRVGVKVRGRVGVKVRGRVGVKVPGRVRERHPSEETTS
jgi:hypothetical protein